MFNWNRPMIDWNRPLDIRTQRGEKVIIYCTDAEGPYPVHGRIVFAHDYSIHSAWTIDGKIPVSWPCGSDLIQLQNGE